MDFSPPSLDVRNVNRIGVSPSTSRRAFIVSSVFAKSKISSYQSTRHSTTSAFVDLIVSAAARISSLVTPTIGTQIFGIPAPISIFLTFTVFIILFLSMTSLEGNPHRSFCSGTGFIFTIFLFINIA